MVIPSFRSVTARPLASALALATLSACLPALPSDTDAPERDRDSAGDTDTDARARSPGHPAPPTSTETAWPTS